MAGGRRSDKAQLWNDARKRHRLSHAQVGMARQLGMNPKKLGKIDNHKQEPWKLPLPQYIEMLYYKRFGKERPDSVPTIEHLALPSHRNKQRKNQAGTEGSPGRREEFPRVFDDEAFPLVCDDEGFLPSLDADVLSDRGGGGTGPADFVPTDDDDVPFIAGVDVSLNGKFRF
jgi:hypothetical protein